MNYLLTIVIIGVVIFVHELGHFLAARRVGIPIRIFSLGFGPKLLARIWKGTEYRLSLIPLGGYVMPAVQDEEEFFRLPAVKRIIMSAGGPAASIILAIICFALVNLATLGFSLNSLFIMPIRQSFGFLGSMLALLPRIFSKPSELMGIVGVVAEGGKIVGNGAGHGLIFTALLTLNLAFINLLPLPVFDGGKILLCLFEKIHLRFLRWQVPLVMATWVLLIGFLLYITVLDVGRLYA
jgi:regulator of sigma E protease